MHKAIEKVEAYKKKTIESALSKAKEQYEEAVSFYNDTGYDRYFNKMRRLENEINELEDYFGKDESAIRKELEFEKRMNREELKKIKKDLMNKIFYLLKVVPDCSEAKSFEAYIKNLED